MFLSLSFAVFPVGFMTSATANPGLTTMTATIEGTWYFDIDTGLITTNLATGDLWWEQVTTGENAVRYIVPENGAMFANLGIVDFSSVVDCSVYTLSAELINGSVDNNKIPAGTVLVARTNLGNYAKMRIDVYGYNLNVTIVYQDDGTTIVPEFSSLTVLLISLSAVTGITIYACKSKDKLLYSRVKSGGETVS